MEPLLVLVQTYKHQSSMIYLVLKYVVDWVDGQVAFLEAKDITILFSFCVQLLEIYSTHNIGKVSIMASVNLLSKSQIENYKDLRALLQLLTNLSSKNLINFACNVNGEVENFDVAQYFTLLAHILEVYPKKVAKLSFEGFARIMSTLDFGLEH